MERIQEQMQYPGTEEHSHTGMFEVASSSLPDIYRIRVVPMNSLGLSSFPADLVCASDTTSVGAMPQMESVVRYMFILVLS